MIRLAVVLALAAGLGQAQSGFQIHTFHAAKLGRLDCKLCHASVAKGSVELKPPGPEQCKLCHSSPVPIPSGPAGRLLVPGFSHTLHADAKARIDTHTGFRADCAHCHSPEKAAERAAMPTHTQCATCHGKPGMQPELTPFLRTAGCRGCHNPEAWEHGEAKPAAAYPNIRFSHQSHFQRQPHPDCTACHAFSALPAMSDCGKCHSASRKPPAPFGIANCGGCHRDSRSPDAKPAFHTGAFRSHHEAAASAPDAKCYACHQNVAAAATREQCVSCHQIMKPVSHSARWKDDIHGKYAALDRRTCATCHTTDYCSRCHNELPNSHLPLPVFKNGGHANLAALNERSCLTCHTFQNTCASCHARQLTPKVR